MSFGRILLLTALPAAGLWHFLRCPRAPDRAPDTSIVALAPAEGPFHQTEFISEEVPGQINHVSALTPIDGGRMAAVWYAGTREGAGDVDIVYAETTKTGWSAPRVLVSRALCQAETGRWVKKLGNPVLFRDPAGRLWLFYASVAVGGWSGSSVNYRVSADGGRTWSRSEKLILSPFFNLTHNVKNKALFLADGSFLLPLHHEFVEKRSDLLRVWPDARGGVTYRIERMTRRGRAIQPALVALGGSRVSALFRNMGEPMLLCATSDDAGDTWSDLRRVAPHPRDTALDVLRLGSGALLAALNDGDDRTRLSLRLSEDEGGTWRVARTLEHRAGEEYSYPFLERDDAGRIHLSYTFERKRIKHHVFNEAWLRQALPGREGLAISPEPAEDAAAGAAGNAAPRAN